MLEKSIKFIYIPFLFGLSQILMAQGQNTISFQDGVNGYNGTRDTRLISANPNINYGNADELRLDGGGALTNESSLIYWDLTDIPIASTIDSVMITLDTTNSSNDTYEFYEMKRAWVEGEATWNNYAAGFSWGVPGADGTSDRGSTVLGTITPLNPDSNTISLNAAGVGMVQSWVNNPSSNNGFIIMDYSNSNGAKFASSDEPVVSSRPKITVVYSTLPNLTLTSPNGAESWQIGSLHNITWISSGSPPIVKLEYSTNNGVTWNTITTSTSNDGTEPWTVPNDITNEALVRISDLDDDPTDQSDQVFSIVEISPFFQDGVNGYNGTRDTRIFSTTPGTNYGNGDELHLDNDESTLLSWDLTSIPIGSTINSVDVTFNITNLSTDTYEFYEMKRAWVENEATWNNYASGLSWGVPGADGTADRGSTVLGTITPSTLGSNTISLNAAGVAMVQSWVNNPSTNHGFIIMDYSNSNGADFSSREVVTVSDRPNLTINYTSLPTLTLTSPNGTESWEVGSSQNITWSSTGSLPNVKLEYSSDGGTIWNLITATTTNDGTESWTVPNDITATALVRISDLDDDPTDQSDQFFSIAPMPTLTVVTPNGGEIWETNSTQEITWGSVNTSGTVKVEYSVDNGLTWIEIFSSIVDDGTESWIVPDTPTNQAFVRISDTDGNGPMDTSSAVFTITPTPVLTVTSPNSGESWEGGSVQNITWSSVNTSGAVKIEYSADNGLSWSDIYSSTTDDGTEPWTVPDTSTTQALVRISDTDGNGPADTSDVLFTITPTPNLTITTPNGGESWEGNSIQNITWSSVGTSGTVKIEYSIDNGLSWSDIIASTSDDGTELWTIPDASSFQVLVRISDIDGNGPSDTSDAVFTISPTPTLIVVTPNGGEIWEIDSTRNITWNSLNTSGTVKIEYSIDNGVSWSDILTSSADDGTEPWIIPNTPTSQALIRISDTDGNGPVDTSDVVFIITPTPTLTVGIPNGGESWEGGSVQYITWGSTGTLPNVKLEYSSNGGTSWNLITATTTNDGTEPWIIPNTPTSQALVRVSDPDGNGPVDISDVIFTITPTPVLTVNSPNGGETWEVDSTQNISWSSVNTSGTVKIEYSADSGLSWSEIIASTSDDGIEPWTIPDTFTTQALVRISDTDGDGPVDTSDAVFTLTPMPAMTVGSPNGGESWEEGSVQNITWSSVGASETVKIEFSVNNGASWTDIFASTANDGTEPWTIPDTPTNQALVRISDTDGNGPVDTTDAVFTITPTPTLTILTPNGGESWEGGSVQIITWSSTGILPNVKLEYSSDGGTTWNLITATTSNDGTEPWTIPDNSTTQALVRISDTDGNGPVDASNTVFTITPTPILTILTPNGGESWEGGSVQNITWNSVNTSGFVKLEYSVDNGLSWNDIITSTSDDGSEPWTIPDAPSIQALARISDTDGDGPVDSTDAVFTITPTPTLTILTPNGGEIWEGGSVQNITWSSVNTSGFVKIEYSTNNGLSWNIIIASAIDDGSESWIIPDIYSAQALVRISDTDGNGPIDVSNAVFTITPPPTVSILTPNGGEIWEGGSVQIITWSSTGILPNVKLEYSSDGGTTWNLITATTTNDGTEPWTIPDTPTNQGLVRISDTDGNGPVDTSNLVFTITPTPVLTVTSPNGGESWEGGSVQNIIWNSVNTSGFVKIEYSVDNGLSWSDIITSTTDDGTEPWTVPDASTIQALVRISDIDGNGPVDISDLVFAITPTPTIIILTPNGGESWEGGTIQNITWSSVNISGAVKIEYSTNNGLSWSDIIASTTDDGTEPWIIPDTYTTQALVRISDTDGNGPVDTSNTVFTITPTPVLTVTSPNGGESWDGGSFHYITWNSMNTTGTVKIEYSANNGVSWSNITVSTPDTGSFIWVLPDISTTQTLVRISDTDGNGPVDTSDAVFTITSVPPGEPIIFSATGCVPYGLSEVSTFQQQIADHNLYSPSEFFVHKGDIKDGSDPCNESFYSNFAADLMELAVPVFIVPGDNETVDCADEDQGWAYWYQYFLDFELNYCGAPIAEKQTVRPENFAFVSKGVLFIGINLVAGASDESMVDDADWVEQQFQQKASQVRGAVIFSQAGPKSSRDLFFDRFDLAAQNFARPVLFLHADGHAWIKDKPFTAPNVLRVQTDNGGSEEPVQVTVTKNYQDMFDFLRDPFSDNPPLYNVIPCVEASLTNLTATADLGGKATDDGVPTSPGTLTTTWSKINGPGTVTFNNPNDVITSVSFSLPGNYLLRLTADDGVLQNYDELTVDVTPAITVASPNGGEIWEGGSIENITWNSVGTSGSVKIEYSVNNGVSWSNIHTSTPDDGTESWIIPDTPTTQALLRISDSDGNGPVDTSDAVFSITPTPVITVTSPNGGEIWAGGTLENITWSSANISGVVKIEYSTNNGASWSDIIASTTDDGTEPWIIPNTPTTQALLRIRDSDGNGPVDTSDAVFTITPTPVLTVTSPNGGESWEGGTVQNITWSSVNISGMVNIEYSVNNGVSWSNILTNTTDDGTEPWIIPDTPTTQALLRISDSDGNGPVDTSDAVFTITPTPVLTVTSPNGAESWEVGSSQNITWNSMHTSGTVKIEYSADNGASWSDINVSTPDTGSYQWTVPNDITANALVRVSDLDDYPTDISDALFNIVAVPTLTIITPNGGESWEGGTVQNITWSSVNTSGAVKLEYSADNGASWSDIIASTPDTGSYPWTIPDTSTGNALVTISDTDGNGPADTSDVVFTITPTPVLTIISPNGGESWEGGSIENITWSSLNSSGNVKIEYSADNGTGWSEMLAITPDDGTEAWTIPDTSTTQALVRISDADGNEPIDTSDAVFTITPTPTLAVVTPNGGESWDGGSVQSISWSSVATSGTVKIEYSADNGLSWSNIIVSTPDTGSYPWTVPDTSTVTALVAISDTDGNGPEDSSDAIFTITPTPVLTIISPNGSESWESGSIQNIAWNSINTSGNVKLEFSADNGLSWSDITVSTPDTGSYLWTLPDTATITALVGISDADGNGPTDSSDTVFSITNSPILLEVKIFLEGPYHANGDTMRTDLNTNGFIPDTSIYAENPRSVSVIPDNVVDWVLVQLRNAASDTALTSKSAFLRKDGRIVVDDGVAHTINMDVSSGYYYVIVKHRNHLTVMSADSIALNSSSSTLYDFTTSTNQYYGSDAKQLETNVYGMYKGDANGNSFINSADYLKVKGEIGSNEYFNGDCNMNSFVNSADYLNVKPNIGKTSQVP
jgi:hypothetical protein